MSSAQVESILLRRDVNLIYSNAYIFLFLYYYINYTSLTRYIQLFWFVFAIRVAGRIALTNWSTLVVNFLIYTKHKALNE